MIIRFHPKALQEMMQAAKYYESCTFGLGEDFLAAIENLLQQIILHPAAGYSAAPGVRKRNVAGFPFTILYQIEERKIRVVAIMHQHRKPGYWLDRMEE